MTSPLSTIVFIVENGVIIEGPISSFRGFIEETTTPRGVAAKYHVRGDQLWTWGHQGNFPKMVSQHESEAEAVDALEDGFVYDFWECSDILAFKSRSDAEKYLADCAA